MCSLALPSDQQLDRKSKEAQDTEVLKNARVQEQVRMRMLQKSHSGSRTNGAVLDYELKGRPWGGWGKGGAGGGGGGGSFQSKGCEGGICFCMANCKCVGQHLMESDCVCIANACCIQCFSSKWFSNCSVKMHQCYQT